MGVLDPLQPGKMMTQWFRCVVQFEMAEVCPFVKR
jgi:hypothetical protein